MMPPEMIRDITNRILIEVKGESSSESESQKRMKKLYATHQAFADEYPTMFRMCCGAVTPELSERFIHFRDMMLHQVNSIQENKINTEDAGKLVGTALGHKYLPKHVMDEFGYDSKRFAKRSRVGDPSS